MRRLALGLAALGVAWAGALVGASVMAWWLTRWHDDRPRRRLVLDFTADPADGGGW